MAAAMFVRAVEMAVGTDTLAQGQVNAAVTAAHHVLFAPAAARRHLAVQAACVRPDDEIDRGENRDDQKYLGQAAPRECASGRLSHSAARLKAHKYGQQYS